MSIMKELRLYINCQKEDKIFYKLKYSKNGRIFLRRDPYVSFDVFIF